MSNNKRPHPDIHIHFQKANVVGFHNHRDGDGSGGYVYFEINPLIPSEGVTTQDRIEFLESIIQDAQNTLTSLKGS